MLSRPPRLSSTLVAAAMVCAPAASHAQQRSDDNAVTQAEDAFGFSVGRESLGIYNAGNARGFSPTAAGNVRIDGLYFDPEFGLPGTLIDNVSIKVGLSAQGYPFVAPSGIVDYALIRPGDKSGASIVTNFDSFGTIGVEVDGTLPVSSKLSLGYGLNGTRLEFPDGTDNVNHTESLIARWRPAPAIEIMPFWSIYNDYNDEAGSFFVPVGDFLPKLPKQRHNEGAKWADWRYTGLDTGMLASAGIAENWLLRLGAFRSVNDTKHSYANLLLDEQPDGSGERVLYADPPTKQASNSGEIRLTHSILDGPRLHVIHLSVRERDARREFGGSDFVDFGPGQIGHDLEAPEPEFHYSETSRDHLTQTTVGAAYDGRWKNVGEVSFGVARAYFHKATLVPGEAPAVTRSTPLLYNATAAANLGKNIAVYAGYARGLEESGTAPQNATNRNQPLPAILTQQKDAGVRFAITDKVKAVAGIFDLTRPYFGFNSANLFTQIGTVESRGAEFSLSGSLTSRLSVVAGGVFLKPRVTASNSAEGDIGSKPVGIPAHLLIMNANWKTPAKGLELDLGLQHRGSAAATTNNAVFIPARARVDVGGHYRFKLADKSATFRLQMVNLFNNAGYGLAGSGVYVLSTGRFVQGYLTVDL